MNSLFDFIIKPKENRYTNTKKVSNTNLILNTDTSDHRYVSREAIVISEPKNNVINVTKGDNIIVHHNIFRRFYDVHGVEKNSKSYFKDDMYFCDPSQVFFNITTNTAIKNYCFIQPIVKNQGVILEQEFEEPLKGIVAYTDNEGFIEKNDLVGFTPESEYEFIINGKRLYRVPIKSISIKYERKGTEVEYNPSWL